jgi:hypothetical protein
MGGLRGPIHVPLSCLHPGSEITALVQHYRNGSFRPMERGLPDEFKLKSSMIKYTKKYKYTVVKKTQEQPGAYAETSHRKMRA